AVSGVSLVDSLNYLILQVLFALTAGGTVVCARFIGKKDEENAGRAGGQLLFITVSVMIVVTIVFLAGNRLILGFIFGQVEPAVMDNASLYLVFTTLSMPFLAIYHSAASIFRSVGQTKVSMAMSLLMNLLNIVGNAFCIFGLKMGVEGVGIPTLLSRVVGAVVILASLQKKDNPIRVKGLNYLKPQCEMLKGILSIGIPNSMEGAVFQLGKLILQSLVSTLGTPSIAAFAVASNLVTYLYLPGNALGAGTLIIVGQCYGAGEYEQARYFMKKLLKINYTALVVIGGIMFAASQILVGLYNLEGISAEYAQGLLISHIVAMVLWPLAFLTPYYFRAIGKATFTMIVAVATMWIFRVGLAYVFVRLFNLNVMGVWYAMYCDWICRVIIYIIAFSKDKRTVARETGPSVQSP
ncbi:MAG: MATE family efflux transporter, partial [Lachnospiraceae bacterium]|nr:MATE family efflux transporter [Lachnospiraceae bacterium]